MVAAGRGWLKVVEECLRAGQSVNAKDSVCHNLRFHNDYNRVLAQFPDPRRVTKLTESSTQALHILIRFHW